MNGVYFRKDSQANSLRVNVRRILCFTLLVLWLNSLPPLVYADPPTISPDTTVNQPASLVGPTPIEFQISPSGDILISVQLNGNTPATFLLDSGFGDGCITDTLAKKLNLTPKPVLGPDGKPATVIVKQAQYVTTSLQIDSIPIPSCPLIVVTEDQLHLNSIVGKPVDGIIGANILKLLPCFLDFQKHQVIFFPTSPLTSGQRQDIGMQDAISCPLTTQENGGHYSVSAHMINGTQSTDEDLEVDLGSPAVILSENAANQLQLMNDSKITVHSVYGNLAMGKSVLPILSFPAAGITLKSTAVVYAKQKMPDDFSGILGRGVLSQFQVLLDYGAKMMYLKPVTAPVPAMATSLISDPTDAPIVQLSLQGKTSGTKTIGSFLIAINALLSDVPPAMADKLGITPTPALTKDGKPLLVDGQAAQAIHVSQTDLGGQPLLDTPFVVLPAETFANGGHPVDGILGMNVLGSHAFLLDMAKKQVTFWGAGAFTSANLQGVDMADAAVVPITPDETTNPGSSIQLFTTAATLRHGETEAKATLHLDTVDPSNFISGDVVTKLGLSPLGSPLVLPSPAGTFTIARTLIPDASLGALTVKDLPMAYSVGATPPDIVPRLAIAFFSQNRVLFDFAHKVMYVKPNPPSAPAATTPPVPASTSSSH